MLLPAQSSLECQLVTLKVVAFVSHRVILVFFIALLWAHELKAEPALLLFQ